MRTYLTTLTYDQETCSYSSSGFENVPPALRAIFKLIAHELFASSHVENTEKKPGDRITICWCLTADRKQLNVWVKTPGHQTPFMTYGLPEATSGETSLLEEPTT